ncbi:hypothetical protein RND81_10G048100 [Saponaria officinalis]|uniref:Uncharacterized protein n=1 Tax=Saponaria officinalis TaxID=3572 RepID=A0AAW1HXV5_SAPOF
MLVSAVEKGFICLYLLILIYWLFLRIILSSQLKYRISCMLLKHQMFRCSRVGSTTLTHFSIFFCSLHLNLCSCRALSLLSFLLTFFLSNNAAIFLLIFLFTNL